ncbi:MAG: membrane protein insertase YidC [Pirellulaceae bacterium]|nr:MAG: membrane protein insertase YidC [Pirellulaceae bacterium]
MSAERRLLLFMLLTSLVLMGHLLLNQWLAPPQPPVPDVAQQAGTEKKSEPIAEPAVDTVPQSQDQAQAGSEGPVAGGPTAAESTEKPKPTRWVTLGSYAAESPYRLLAVFTTQGAALERLELVERTASGRLRFRSLEDPQGGYLGYLALQDESSGGCRIHVVPPGTPAARAEPTSPDDPVGLQVGDLLLRVGAVEVQHRADVARALLETHPGDRIEVLVRRGDQQVRYTVQLAEQPLVLISPESPGQLGPGPNPPSLRCLLGVPEAIRKAVPDLLSDSSLAEGQWEVAAETENSVTFQLASAGGKWQFRKTFFLTKPSQEDLGYHIDVELELENRSSSKQSVAVQWEGPNGLPTEGWWYSTKVHHSFFGVAGARDLIWSTNRGQQLKSATEIHRQLTGQEPRRPVFTPQRPDDTTPLRFVGVDTQYFAAVFSHPEAPAGERLVASELVPLAWGDLRALPKDRLKLTNVSFRLGMPVQQLEPGQKHRERLRLFAGPKDPEVLRHYALEDVIYYGWFPWVAKPLSAVLHLFYLVVRNYGLAIVLLTVVVRGAMFPLGRKAARNAAIMQELAPELKRIGEKYKNDPQKRIQAQQELYRKYNFNPFSGCLLMFIQLPIFVGLYRCLAVDIHLRQAPLIPGISWCSNLAGPDQLWRWPLPEFLAGETAWLGPYLNVLPIITIVLFLWQQKMFTPPPTDEQQRVQQQMMTFMMIFIGIMFFKVPSGLCIYFIASSLWSVGERLLLPKPTPGEMAARAAKVQAKDDPAKRRASLLRTLKTKRR